MATALGTDDSVTTCDCCGKTNLKSTVIIQLDSGEIVHYGSVCACRNTGKERKTILQEIKTYHTQQVKAAREEYFASAACIAERARFTERDSLPWDHPSRQGMRAAEFVRDATEAANEVRKEIAARFGLSPWEISA
jgi:hypothetical protein